MADYDDPRPSSQPTGSTEGVVAEDNLITLDTVMTAPTGTKITNRKGKVLTPMVDIVGEAQAIVQNAIDQISSVVSVPDGNISLTQTGAELQAILNDSASVLKAAAISAGTTVENVMLATNTTDAIVGYIYDADEQVTYSVPSDAQGKFIDSVVGRVLTTTDASVYTLESKHEQFGRIAVVDTDNVDGGNKLFMRENVTDDNPSTITAQIQRIVDTTTGSNPKALRVKTIMQDGVEGAEWVVSGELDNYSNSGNDGSTAVSGVSNKYGTNGIFAGHFQSNDYNEYATPSDVTATLGVEMNLQVIGPDHPTLNRGVGVRTVLDLIARTNTVLNSEAESGEVGTALRIRSDSVISDGFFRYGIVIEDGSGNSNSINHPILLNTNGEYGIELRGNRSVADFWSDSTVPVGILLSGDYDAAIRISANNYISYEGTDSIKQGWNSVDSEFEILNGTSKKVSFGLGLVPSMLINSEKVIGARATGWESPTGDDKRTSFETSTVSTENLARVVKALLSDLTTHGLIGE